MTSDPGRFDGWGNLPRCIGGAATPLVVSTLQAVLRADWSFDPHAP